MIKKQTKQNKTHHQQIRCLGFHFNTIKTVDDIQPTSEGTALKNCYSKTPNNSIKIWQVICINISPKKTYKWLIKYVETAQHYYSSGKCKSKSHTVKILYSSAFHYCNKYCDKSIYKKGRFVLAHSFSP
jgi:hypothetical protein